jgi:hypothetical protein
MAAAPAGSGQGVVAELAFIGPQDARVGEEFEVMLEATVHEPLRRLPLAIRFDPQVLSFVDARPGPLAQASGIQEAAPAVDRTAGRLDLELAAPDKPLAGQGRLLTLRFAAASPRAQTRIALGQISLANGEGLRTIPRPRTLLMRVTP